MISVYGDSNSGNCLKVRWLLDYLGEPYEWIEVDVAGGGARSEEFRCINPAAQVPAVVLADGRTLAQSNAIVLHLAAGTNLVPEDPFARAKMLEWMFWEQYSHEPTIAVRRYHKVYLRKTDSEIDAALLPKGHAALERLERQLSGTEYLVGDNMTAADICLFPYTMLAPQGGFDLADYPGTRSWLARIASELGVMPNAPFQNAATAAAANAT